MYIHVEHDWHELVAQLSLRGRHEASLYVWTPAMMWGGGRSLPHSFSLVRDYSRRTYGVVTSGCSRTDTIIFLHSFLPQTLIRQPKQLSSWANRLQFFKQEGQIDVCVQPNNWREAKKTRVKKGTFQPWLLTQVDQRWHREPCTQSARDSEISSSSPAFEARNSQRTLIWNFYGSGLLEPVLFQSFRGERTCSTKEEKLLLLHRKSVCSWTTSCFLTTLFFLQVIPLKTEKKIFSSPQAGKENLPGKNWYYRFRDFISSWHQRGILPRKKQSEVGW